MFDDSLAPLAVQLSNPMMTVGAKSSSQVPQVRRFALS